MAFLNPCSQYRQTQIITAPPERLVLMSYDGVIRFLEEARLALLQGKPAGAHEKLVRAQDILAELMCSLNLEYEVSGVLYRLYDYFCSRLVIANVRKEIGPIEEILGFLRDLRQVWYESCCQKNSAAPQNFSDARRVEAFPGESVKEEGKGS